MDDHSKMVRIHGGLPLTKTTVSEVWKGRSCAPIFQISYIESSCHLSRQSDTNSALHYYSDDNVKTKNGVLSIKSELKDNVYRAFNEKTKKFYIDTKNVQSAMVQGWNKFCMTGGIIEFSAKLPGSPTIGGLWPARKLTTTSMVLRILSYFCLTFLLRCISMATRKSRKSYLRWILGLHVAL